MRRDRYILHASTDPDLLTRLREMLDSSARADNAVGYFFMPGFGAISTALSRLDKVRILDYGGHPPQKPLHRHGLDP